MSRMDRKHAERVVRYCQSELAEGDLSEARRENLTARLAATERYLAEHCRDCGRPLTDPESIARGVGPECAKAVAR